MWECNHTVVLKLAKATERVSPLPMVLSSRQFDGLSLHDRAHESTIKSCTFLICFGPWSLQWFADGYEASDVNHDLEEQENACAIGWWGGARGSRFGLLGGGCHPPSSNEISHNHFPPPSSIRNVSRFIVPCFSRLSFSSALSSAQD